MPIGPLKSLFNPVSLFQLAMGPAGWAAMASKMLVGTAMNTVIQNVGERLGLPNSVINLAQNAFNQSYGFTPTQGLQSLVNELADQVGASPFERGEMSRQMDFFMEQVQAKLEKAIEEAGNGPTERGRGGKGKSFLMKLAEAMGKVLDDKMQQMIETGEKIDKESGKKKPKLGTLSAQMTALGKELDFVSQALNNALKSLGDTASTLARKQ